MANIPLFIRLRHCRQPVFVKIEICPIYYSLLTHLLPLIAFTLVEIVAVMGFNNKLLARMGQNEDQENVLELEECLPGLSA